MTGINIITKFFIISTVIISGIITPCTPAISDRRLCFDQLCSVPISTASTVMAYGSNDPGIMSFKSNAEVTVFSKSAGNRQDLWGVEIDGKRGYVPMNMLREKRVFKKKLIHEVPTESIASLTPDDSPKKHERDSENVPNISSEIIAPPENVDDEYTKKIDENSAEAPSTTAPVADQVSPSYEIVDGTTITLAHNDEASEPSYATQIPRGIEKSMEQQPIMTIHPSIASTFTFETAPKVSNQESKKNVENPLETTPSKDESLDNKITEKATTELPYETPTPSATLPDVDSTNETNVVDSATNTNDLVDKKNGDAVEKFDNQDNQEIKSSQENIEKTKVVNAQADDSPSEKNEDKELQTSDDVQNATVEIFSEVPPTEINTVKQENVDIAINETAEPKENISTDDVDNQNPNEIDDKSSEENQNATVETFTEVKTEKLPEDNKKMENNLDNQDNSVPTMDNNQNNTIDTISKITDENSETVTRDSTIEQPDNAGIKENNDDDDDDSEEADDDEDEEDEDADVDDENDENNDLPKNNDDQQKPTEENNLPNDQTLTEKPIEATKPTEQPPTVPKPHNIMSPLFSRLSAIPDVVKGFVVKTLSSDNSDVKTIANEEIDVGNKPETKKFNDDDFKNCIEVHTRFVDLSDDNGQSQKIVYDSKLSEDNSKNDATDVKSNVGVNEFVNNNNPVDSEIGNVNKGESVDNENTEKLAVENSTEELIAEKSVQPGIFERDEITGFRQDDSTVEASSSFNGFPANRNLLNVGSGLGTNDREHGETGKDEIVLENKSKPDFNDSELVEKSSENFEANEKTKIDNAVGVKEEAEEKITEEQSKENFPETVDSSTVDNSYTEQGIVGETLGSGELDGGYDKSEGDEENHNFVHNETEEEQIGEEGGVMESFTIGRNYWETLTYLVITALTTLLFSLGYYYIENTRRDGQLIAKINILEKELLVASKECMVLDDTLKSTKTKLDSIEDESFGSNEMVVSLKTDLEAMQAAKSELEEQLTMLEKELETATEAGLELERMLREILSTNNQDNPLAQSVEDLQTRLNAQQAANEALTNALNLKAQENESLTTDLATITQKCEQLEVEVTRVTEELKHRNNVASNLEQNLMDKLAQLENKVKDIAAEKSTLRKQLKIKEMELKDLREVVDQMNVNNLDFEKLYNVSRIKAEASQLLEERDELQMTLSEVEGAHQLLEEHTRLISEEVLSLSEQCKLAEKAKRDAETRVEVLSNFFKEKEAQRQKEEAVWLQKQGEVSSTVERLHTMQNEIHNYKQQIEMLKREILDQEREYKSQIANLETKTHEHWVIARQNERRLEESKAEAGQLRNRLTLIEKNLNDADPEAKLHRLESNGETATSPQLFIGAEASSSPIMFTGPSGVPYPPPSSYRYCPPPPFMPPPSFAPPGIPPYDVGQRPPPLGGRLSSPPPLPGSNSGRYDDRHRSPPPPLSPSILPPFGGPHRNYPPPPFANDRVHPPPPPPPHSSMLPPPPPLGPSAHSWTNENPPPPPRNSGFRAHQQHQHRDQQRSRNHKGSLHSSGESLDKTV